MLYFPKIVGNLEKLHRYLSLLVEPDNEIELDIELVDDDMEASSKVVKNFVDTASLTVRVDKMREKPNPKFLNKLQDKRNEGKKETTLEILSFILNLENLVQSKQHSLQN